MSRGTEPRAAGGRADPRLAEYVDDVPYPRNFVPNLAPSAARLVAALAGFEPPPGDAFDACELGPGRGDTLVTLAAANPSARFVGVELSPEHVAYARGFAERGEVENVTLLRGDFGDPELLESVGTFDFIGAHGVLSWISPEKRAALFAFAGAKLKPGGVLFVSYNALPGWAVMEPLRRIMLEHAARVEGTTLDRARAAFEFATKLAEAKAGFFTSHPTALKMLELMRDGGLAYVAHEYFHAHWAPMHFADMEAEAARAGLAFAGGLPLYLNVPELALPPSLHELGRATSSRTAFETLKDFACNELFRSDVFVRAGRGADPNARARFFETTAFGCVADLAQVKRAVRLPFVSLDFSGPVYDAILPHFARGPASARDLARRPELARLGAGRIAQCLQNLCLGGQVLPMRAAASAPTAFNRVALDEALFGDGPLALACPATGSGLAISRLEAVFLALGAVAPSDHAAWIERLDPARTLPLTAGTRRVETLAELAELVRSDLALFERGALPRLERLGVVRRQPA